MALGRYPATVGRMLRERRDAFGDRLAYRERLRCPEYESLTYAELYDRAARVGSALLRLGLRKGDRVASLSRNRAELLILELATMSVGGVVVPIFADYPASQLEFIFEHCGARWLVVSDPTRLAEALGARSSERLERIFVMDFDARAAQAEPERVLPFDRLLARRKEPQFERRLASVQAADPCLLMYTSGTTGKPKGVLLCHRNILSQRKGIGLLWDLRPEDRFLSYLPWHHSFGGIFELFGALYSGASLTLDESYGKDLSLLIENFKRVQPTVYFSVPRIYQALVAEAQASSRVEREIFHPRLRFVFTAAAALPPSVSRYFEAKGIPVVEGWGLTETSPCVTVTPVSGARVPGVVGRPLPGVRVKLAEDGEILVQGPNVMLGYFRDAKRTSRAVDPMGWFHTGDFGELGEGGLVLKGRMDGLFKLISGQMVVSQEVESALVSSPLISFAAVYGSGEDFVGAVIFPSVKEVSRAARARGIEAPAQAPELLRHPRVRELLKHEIKRACSSIGAKYQRPKAFVVAREEPSLRNGEITPTLKIVKPKVAQDYEAQFRAMFKPEEADPRAREEVIRLI
ncbi:MAG: AMP-binding protein [Elusimicrobia bacterium]|nr:AMP-binding protein [Elusimicrobiota bacterium]